MAIRVQIDGYDSLEQIGVGGMAAVYKARKISIDKTVAIKVLFPYLATDSSFAERFQREAKAAARIQHENIVNVIDFGESEGSFYIVMEYYQGRTLEDLMKARPGVPFDIAAQVVIEVAYGLEAAHHQDIVHRDIKPANIIFTDQGGIKLADFGLAKKSDSMTMITQLGKVIGTPAYMSPEQAAGRPVGTASDMFSLGVVAYELFGRRKPFEGKTYSDVLEKIQTCDPPVVTTVNPLIEPEFAAIVTRMLEKNDRDRYPNATALITELEAAMETAKISRDRRRLASYIKNPVVYDAAVLEKTVANCLSRGTFFLQKGQHHLDDAELEFRRILFLDPTNERARKNLDRIKSQQGGVNRTMSIDAAPAPDSPRTTQPIPARARAPQTRRRKWPWATVAVAMVGAMVATAVWLSTRTHGTAGPNASVGPSSASLVEKPVVDLTTVVREDVAPSTTTRDTTRIDNAGTTGSAKPESATDMARDSKRTGASLHATKVPERKTDSAKPSDTVASRASAEASRTTSEKSAEPSRTGASGTKTATSDVVAAQRGDGATRPARDPAKPADGTLSVYFLGGVGEFFVNGKRFGHQPPFDGVAMPAGSYRVACRMSGDAAPREFAVTIQSDRETIVEYEIGKDPVVTTE